MTWVQSEQMKKLGILSPLDSNTELALLLIEIVERLDLLAAQQNDLCDSIMAVQKELGVNPSGLHDDVAGRFTELERSP